jgi:predicted outer membrane repeat protein
VLPRGNTATDRGGGIFNYSGGKMWLTDCTISGNSAAVFGGAIRNEGDIWLTNCTISGNWLTDVAGGGGIWNDGLMDLLNCTIAYNSTNNSPHSAGGGFMSIQNDTTYFKNTIVANNTAGSNNFINGYMEWGLSTSRGHNLCGDDSCGFDRPSDLVKTDPLLGPLQDNGGPTFTHALLHGSPAIDRGANAGAPATDQRGTPRPQGTRCDIGAYELTQASVATATGIGTASFSTTNGYITGLTAIARPDCPPRTDLDFPHGFFSFTIRGITPGSSATVVIILPSDMPTDTEYWKCINGKWVDCTSLLGSNDGDNVLTITIKDGGLGDRDKVQNGRISDPGGPAVAATAVAPTVPTPAPPGPRTSPTPPRPLNPPQMSLQYLSVTPQQTTAGQPVTITTNVVNTGDEAGNLNVALKINGQVEETRPVSVGPQGTQPVKFTITKAQPGTYTVDISGQQGSFTVLGSDGTAGRPVNGGMIAILIVGILVLATIVALIATRRRPT